MDGQAFPGRPFPGDDAGSADIPPREAGNGPAWCDDGLDDDGHFEWLVREIEAGRLLPPPESAIEGPAVSVSLGDACDVDPELLAAVSGPDGLGGQAALGAFGEGRAADVLRPGPILAALTAQAVTQVIPGPAGADGTRSAVPGIASPPAFRPPAPAPAPAPPLPPASLTDDELIGVLQATRRLANLASWQQTVVIAEFARRRQAEFEAARARGVPVGCRDGEFPGEELAMELVASGPCTAGRIDTAIELTSRLPLTLAGMEDGTIDLARACAIASRTCSMTDGDAAYADRVLAAAAPGLRLDQLARKAEALEKRLAPEAVAARKKLARQLDQRVEARREESGNASLSGRELDPVDVIASKAYVDAIAVKLRNAGLDGTIGRLRALALIDLTQGRDPLDRIIPCPAPAPGAARADGEPAGGHGADDEQPTGQPSADPSCHVAGASGISEPAAASPDGPFGDSIPDDGPSRDGDEAKCARHDPALADRGDGDPAGDNLAGNSLGDNDSLRHAARPGDPVPVPVPVPAMINVLVPAGTLLGWSTAPGQAAGWGLLDADETRTLLRAAALHPRTRWCFTLTAPDGTAVAHACASGRRPWRPPGPPDPGSPDPGPPNRDIADRDIADRDNRSRQCRQGAALAFEQTARLVDFLRSFDITFEPIARDTCDHRHAEDRYVPSRKLKHLLRARNQTCTAPGCNAQAIYCDIDHTVPYPDGLTDECNTNPKCRRHHRTKQAPGWQVDQPTPDTATWVTPSGRSHTTTATAYEL